MKKGFRTGRFWFWLPILLLVGLLLVTTVDTTDYPQTDFYATTMARKDSLIDLLSRHQHEAEGSKVTNQVHAGWGKANITPDPPVRLTGKNFTPFNQVFDSVYVRSMLFSNSHQRVLMLNYDLWIIHPHLADYVRRLIAEEFPTITGVYFTANHTHTSIGGWASGILGQLVVGGNSEQTLKFIGEQTLRSVKEATQNLSPTLVGFGAIETEGLVMNRLDTTSTLDTKLRVLMLSDSSDRTASFSTFSAHSVYMNKDINTLSADYPGPYLNYLEAMPGIDFASFAPGATGSHTPIGRKPFEHSKMLGYSKRLAGYFETMQSQVSMDTAAVLKHFEWPVDLRSPHFRITNRLRFRPWLFHAVMGQYQPHISVLRVGDVVLVGLPVELSGEYYPQFTEICKARGLSLMITSFNGWYMGYVNPEKYYYTLRRSETREMNWFGPQNGEYFVELVKHVLEIV